MKSIITGLNWVLPLSYLVTVIIYTYAFFSSKPGARKLKSPFLVVTLLLHIIYIVTRTIYFHHPPIITVFDMFCLLAFSIAASYRIVEMVTGLKNTGLLILALAFLFQLISSLFIQEISEVPPNLRSYILGLHVLSALIGYSAFSIAAVYGLLYLFQYNNLKSKKVSIFFEKLPNLEHLEQLTRYSMKLGFILLSVAIVIGMLWLPVAIDNYSFLDPKVFGTVIIWVLYAIGLFLMRGGRGSGRQVMRFAIMAYFITICSLTILNLYFNTFHRFH